MSEHIGKEQAKSWQQSAVQTASFGFSARPFPEIARKEEGHEARLDRTEMKKNQPGGMIDNINRSLASASPPEPIPKLGLGGVQAKLTLGTVGDVYEQEADRVARQVVDEIHSSAFRARNTTSSGESIGNGGEAGRVQRQITVRAKGDAGGDISSQWEGELQRAKGGGQPMSVTDREPMEQGFGANFGGVRVHTGAQADMLARSIQAKAFTTGQDVFFRQGAYEPGSRGGQELLAHELTHVMQQNRSERGRQDNGTETSEHPANANRIQRMIGSENVADEIEDDKTPLLEEDRKPYVELGKSMVACGRALVSATANLKANKNKEVVKEGLAGLMRIATTLAAMSIPVPGMVNITALAHGAVSNAVHTGGASIAKQAGQTASGIAASRLDPKAREMSITDEKEKISTRGAIKSKFKDKFGSKNKILQFGLGLLPGYSGTKSIANAAKTALKSDEEWNKEKGVHVKGLVDEVNQLRAAVKEVGVDYDNLEIVIAGSSSMMEMGKTIGEIRAKFEERCLEFEEALKEWQLKEGEGSTPLLSSSYDGEDTGEGEGGGSEGGGAVMV